MRKHDVIFILSFIFNGTILYGGDSFLLPPGKNREFVVQNCLACHSERLIIQNHLSRKAWDEKITWMQKTQNLWSLDSETRFKILDYLEHVQGPILSEQDRDFMDGLSPRKANILQWEQ